MLQKMLLTTIWGRAILVLSFSGVLLRMITILSYKRMKQAAENPAKTKRQWVLLLKKRYESYEKFGRIKNVEAFVAHYFARKGIMGIPLSVWDKSGLVMAVLTAMAGLFGAGAAFNGGEPVRQIGAYLLLGALSGSVLFLLHIIGDAKETKGQILAALTDYLANGAVQRGNMEGVKGKGKLPTKEEVQALSEAAVTEEEKMVLEEVLEEYFW